MKERAHLMGGDIDIKGVEGKGTVVTVRAPISCGELALENHVAGGSVDFPVVRATDVSDNSHNEKNLYH
jgi:hypothetical protein